MARARRARLPVPVLGDRFPTRGNRFTRAIGRSMLRLLGWEFEGTMPNMPGCVVIAAPHTSNWDLVIGLPAAIALGIRLHFVVTHKWFRPPLGRFMRWLGCVPVDQSASHGVAAQIAAEFRRRPQLVVLFAPEGRRKRVDRWKTGFYHVARSAGVPIVPVRIDWGTKRFGIGPVIHSSGDFDADMAKLRAYYGGVVGKKPEQFSLEGVR